MAGNKFATMLHRNTNKPTLVLVYAFLEWILIILLLLNSLFSYLILKFADYFGLKRPCICCSRIEHIIEPNKCTDKSCFRDLVCESHAYEISKLGYCYNHGKLAESEDMCEDCSSSSSSSSSELDYVKISKSFGFFPWIQQKTVMIQDTDDRKASKCSCCGVHLESRLCPPCFVVKPLDHNQIQTLITQGGIDVDAENDEDDPIRADSVFDHHEDEDQNAKENVETHKVSNVDQPCEPKTGEIPPQHLEFFIHGDNCSLIPFELVDSAIATETQSRHRYKVAEGQEPDDRNEDVILDFDMLYGGAEIEPVFENWHTSGDSVINFSCRKREPKSPSVSLSLVENLEQNVGPSIEEKPMNHNLEAHVESREASEEVTEMEGDELETEVSIGTEIPDHEQVDEYQFHDILHEDSNQHMQEVPSTSSVSFHVQDESGGDREEEFVEFQTMSVETSMPKVLRNHLESSLESNENEAEKIPDTPTSIERKESGTEESLDGSSIISDIEPGDLTIEKLKSALKAERKALSSIYAELEEERNASAEAANQTMAMINRLQEEKAAMQMEALQYQRMMEEQSEYDQEALQLLNDLMVKREKEKQELERELELYRKKVQQLEVKEKSMMSRSDVTNSSVSCSNGEDSDGISVDLNQEAKEDNGFYGEQNTNTPVDAVLYLEESLENFEEERLSILEQLKVLEKKLVMLNHEEGVCHENGNGYHNHVNGFANGHSHINGGRKIMGQKGKRLLPLFDAIGREENGVDLNSLENISMEEADLEEELDNVYERLQALETDREFLKHCINSLRKGDKGIYLLQEILQHLHDLRNVDLRAKNMDDNAV
ncbi:myosin-binding protein 3 [Prosopis cineraria]|uniref:myosin-binding protein 3 n=1 Tax=Prosopis cineraria TaxID=364024 RepID=UPI00240EA0BC|nr:myosin-binding protein 3 [Prosopis cineraria]XP_054822990.1 myosin-binding protein 3 [Prosopis cineraria]XP_054822991.1 myosin-binding protein 3 [Prosopis cineraria]